MRTMIDNAKIAKIEEDIKATDAKVKATDAKIKATDAKVDATNAKVDATNAKVDATNAKVDATNAKVNSINQVPASTAADAGKVLTVGDDGTVSWQTKGAGGGMKAFFDAGGKCAYSKATSFDGVINFGDTADVTDMSNMFNECDNLTALPLIDTSKVTSMMNMFGGCKSLTDVPLIDTSNVDIVFSMFNYCTSLATIPAFHFPRLRSMSTMFIGCSNLTSIPAIDVNRVNDFGSMFIGCTNLAEIHMQNIGADLDISASEAFTSEALNEIIGNLQKVNNATLTMGTNNLAKLTDEDKTVAINKGWTLV